MTFETRLRTVSTDNNSGHGDGAQLYFRQLLSGRDFAVGDPIASQMVNFAYLIGDRASGECLLVDPAYAVGELLDTAAADGMRVTGVLATHYHADHIGGSMMGLDIEGIAALLERQACPIHVQRAEVPWVVRTTGLTPADVDAHDPGDIVSVGAIDVELVHTPGHTPGSQCFFVHGRLVSGDTLFLDGCGRTDLPGSDASAMAESLNRLSKIPDDIILYPGHRYSIASSALMGSVKASNWVFDRLANQ